VRNDGKSHFFGSGIEYVNKSKFIVEFDHNRFLFIVMAVISVSGRSIVNVETRNSLCKLAVFLQFVSRKQAMSMLPVRLCEANETRRDS
jgi:hypothetical protein